MTYVLMTYLFMPKAISVKMAALTSNRTLLLEHLSSHKGVQANDMCLLEMHSDHDVGHPTHGIQVWATPRLCHGWDDQRYHCHQILLAGL